MGLAFVVRSLAAALFAVVAVAGLATLILWSPFAALPGLLLAALPALFGWIAFVVIGRFTVVRGWMAVLAGFLLGAIPTIVFGFSPAADVASANGVPTVMDGRHTLWGWLMLLRSSMMVGFLGSVAALVFWLIVRRVPLSGGGMRRAGLWLVAAVACTVVMASLPLIAKDRTCHNTSRDGATTVSSRLSANLMIDAGDWRQLESVLQAFSDEEGWSLRPRIDGQEMPLRGFVATLCTEPGTMILFMQNIARVDLAARMPSDRSLSINVYQPQGGESWREPAARLMGRLAGQWPGRLRFGTDPAKPAPPPDWLLPALPPDWAANAGS
jgi:hypothetical protein